MSRTGRGSRGSAWEAGAPQGENPEQPQPWDCLHQVLSKSLHIMWRSPQAHLRPALRGHKWRIEDAQQYLADCGDFSLRQLAPEEEVSFGDIMVRDGHAYLSVSAQGTWAWDPFSRRIQSAGPGSWTGRIVRGWAGGVSSIVVRSGNGE